MKKHDGYLWLEVEFSRRLIRKFDPRLFLAFNIVASDVDNRGETAFQKAIDGLVAADTDLHGHEAKEMLTRFIAEGLAIKKGETLVFPGCGTDFLPNQKGRPRKPRTR